MSRARTTPADGSHNRWLVLGIAASVALGVLVALSLAGVFDRGSSRRDAVAAYIEQVNEVQRSVAVDRQAVTNVYGRARSTPAGLAASVPLLQRSTRTLRGFETRLRALRPPPDAVVLHRRLVAAAAAETTFAEQIALLGVFLPALSAERKAVAKAGQSLRVDLRSSVDVNGQAASFRRFAERLERATAPLEATNAPAALEPVKAQELTQMSSLATTARGLEDAVRRRDAADAQGLLHELSVVAAGQGNAVERTAIIAFDAQAKRVNDRRRAVAEERARLDRTLG